MTTIDFGAFPGASDAEVTVPAQTGIVAGSLGEAWIAAKDSVDHSADEHMVETIKADFDHSSIVPGVSFKIKAFNTSQLGEPLEAVGRDPFKAIAAQVRGGIWPSVGGMGTRLYGVWNVGWAGDWTN